MIMTRNEIKREWIGRNKIPEGADFKGLVALLSTYTKEKPYKNWAQNGILFDRVYLIKDDELVDINIRKAASIIYKDYCCMGEEILEDLIKQEKKRLRTNYDEMCFICNFYEEAISEKYSILPDELIDGIINTFAFSYFR